MLLTRSPLYSWDCSTLAFDLHVLGTPPALVLSQDQTLIVKFAVFSLAPSACLTQSALTGLRRIQSPVDLCLGLFSVAFGSRTEPLRSRSALLPTDNARRAHCPTVAQLGLTASLELVETILVCACTHYLVFKEPKLDQTDATPQTRSRAIPVPAEVTSGSTPDVALLGEPSKTLLRLDLLVKPFFRSPQFFDLEDSRLSGACEAGRP